MAWNYDGDGVLAIRSAHGARCFRITNAFCELAVGDGFAVGDLLEPAPHGSLEFRSLRCERQIEFGARTCEVFAQLANSLAYRSTRRLRPSRFGLTMLAVFREVDTIDCFA